MEKIKNLNIRKITKQGTQLLVSIPKNLGLEVGTLVKIIPLNTVENSEGLF